MNHLLAWGSGDGCTLRRVFRRDSGPERGNGEGSAGLPVKHELLAGIGPAMTVEFRQRNAAPVQIKPANVVALDLHMHHHGIRLLDLSNLAQLHVVAESGGKVSPEGISAQITGRHPRQQEKHPHRTQQNHRHQGRSHARQRESQMAMLLRICGMPGLNVGGAAGALHLHQYKGRDGGEHEGGKKEQEDAVDRENGRRQHHEKGENGEHHVVAVAPQRKHAHHHREQRQMNGCSQEAARKKQEIRSEK